MIGVQVLASHKRSLPRISSLCWAGGWGANPSFSLKGDWCSQQGVGSGVGELGGAPGAL